VQRIRDEPADRCLPHPGDAHHDDELRHSQ
jgi:hypothetical protein